LSGEGITVLLSSHLLAEVEELCNRVAIVRKGRIVYEGDLEELRQRAGRTWRLRSGDMERARSLALASGLRDVTAVDGELRCAAEEDAVAARPTAPGRRRMGIPGLRAEAATLEDMSLELTEADEPQEAAA